MMNVQKVARTLRSMASRLMAALVRTAKRWAAPGAWPKMVSA